jgi:hypothetical protein
VCDYRKALELLESIGYEGWVIAEEESNDARLDQKTSVLKNRQYLKSLGY